MSPGAKVFMALLGAGAVIGVIAIAAKPAHAAPGQPKQPKPGSNTPPDVVVPPSGGGVLQQPPPQAAPPPQGAPPQPSFFPPVPSFPPIPNPLGGLPQTAPPQGAPPSAPPAAPPASTPPGTTMTLPNPLGGPPLGTFNPATGSVFGPDGTIVGTFNPLTGLFTAANGMKVQIPGFGSGPLPNVPVPPLPVAPVPSAPPGAAPPAATQATAPVTTVKSDTAAMVSTLLAAEAFPGWNKTDPTVGAWQAARPPLVVDNKFGPKSALAVAASVGTIPLVRFWPLNGIPKQTQLNNYRAALDALANQASDPVRAQQLRFSAAREQALAFSTKGPLPAVPLTDQIQVQQVA